MGRIFNITHMGDVYKILVGKSEGQRPLRIPRHRWEDDIKMDLEEIGFGGYGLDSAGSV
jgi:hypothetical protein